jgi:tetratricopeptide (TPR) repeat protein
MSEGGFPINGKRLDSWKEIATFFGRDERTVSRWEKDLGLPVHRLPGAKGRVYAYAAELSAWLAAPKNTDASTSEQSRTAIPASAGNQTGIEQRPIVETARPFPVRYRVAVRFAIAAVAGTAAVALILVYPHRQATIARPAALSSRQVSPGAVVLASSTTRDAKALQLYLQGRYYWNKRTPEDLNRALDYFMQAVVHDPNYSQAYVGLADCYSLMREYTLMPSSEAYPRALAAAKKAVELDDQSSEAHASLAFVSFFGIWDVATGEREFRRSVDLNSNNATAHHWYANALLAQRRFPEALAEIEKAQALDPNSAAILADKGNILNRAGRSDEAVSLLREIESREPAFRSPHDYLKGAYLSSQDYPDYLSEARKDALLVHDDSELAITAAAEKGFASGGERGMLEGMLQTQKTLFARHSLSATDLAETFAMLGNKSEALRYLKVAYDQRDGRLLFVGIYKEFNCLHNEPAYRDLIARMNLPVQDSQ